MFSVPRKQEWYVCRYRYMSRLPCRHNLYFKTARRRHGTGPPTRCNYFRPLDFLAVTAGLDFLATGNLGAVAVSFLATAFFLAVSFFAAALRPTFTGAAEARATGAPRFLGVGITSSSPSSCSLSSLSLSVVFL